MVAAISTDNLTTTVDNSLRIDSLRSATQIRDGWFRKFELSTLGLTSASKAATLLKHLDGKAIDTIDTRDDTFLDNYEAVK